MSHYYVILSDSEESPEPLLNLEVCRVPNDFRSILACGATWLPINYHFWQRFEGFFIPLRFIQNDMG